MELEAPPAGLGRLVYVADIAPFAKTGHSHCLGKGFVVKLQGTQKEYAACVCAIRRFHKVHKDNIELVSNEYRWKPGKAPPVPDATDTERSRSYIASS